MPTKFNGFEKWLINEALDSHIKQAEAEVLQAEEDGKNSLFAPGYFTMVGKELKEKVISMTLKADQ